jgi:hypothetical protein
MVIAVYSLRCAVVLNIFTELPMKHSNRNTFGLTLVILGFAFLLLNGIDYILGWNQVSSGVSIVGIMLVVIGSTLARNKKDVQQASQK